MKSEKTNDRTKAIRVKSSIKAGGDQVQYEAGGWCHNHNQTLSREAKGLRVKSNLKAGIIVTQHNQTVARGLRVKSGVKAGPQIILKPQP